MKLIILFQKRSSRPLAALASGLLALSLACSDATSIASTPVVTQPIQPKHVDSTPPPAPPGPAHIYVVEPGAAPRRLVAGSWPSWSPDGERLAFQREGEIYTINADGTGETAIASGGGPSWSPDGKKIAFADESGINVMNVDGSDIRLLLRHDFRVDTYQPWDMGPAKPTWSPDGTRIAFEHLGDGDLQPAQIFVMNADGSAVRRESSYANGGFYAESDPAWSPDGTKLAYWSYGGGIVVTDATGGTPQSVYFDFPAVAYGARPAWFPDGSIAFNKHDSGSTPTAATSTWVLRPGAGVQLYTADAFDLAVSRDARHPVAFVSTRSQ